MLAFITFNYIVLNYFIIVKSSENSFILISTVLLFGKND